MWHLWILLESSSLIPTVMQKCAVMLLVALASLVCLASANVQLHNANIAKVDQEFDLKYQERDIASFGKGILNDAFNKIKEFVHDQLEKLGIAEPEQRQKLLDDLKEYINDFPGPPASILDIPEYLQELRDHVQEGIRRVLEAAKKIVGNVGYRISERNLPSIDDIINAGKGFLDNAFNKIKDFVHAQLEKVGLADPEQRQQLLEQLKEYIKSFPAPPSSILEIPDYLRELRKHIEEGVRRVVEAAKKIVGNIGYRISERNLPSIDDIINAGKGFLDTVFNNIKGFVHDQLEKIGLADPEQRQQLLEQLKEYIKSFPAPPSSILEIPEYLKELRQHIAEGVKRVVEAAKKIVGNLGNRISERDLPSIDDIINAGKGFLDNAFNKIKDFVHAQLEKVGLADPEQRQQLLEQLKEYIKSFPAPPSSILEIPEYLKELRQHIAEGVKRVVEAAKKIVGNLGNRISERDLPSIDDIINAGKGFLDNAFNKIKDFVHAQLEKVGLADPEQRQQLLEQLKEYIKSFPAPPSSILEIPDYLRELRKHIEEGVRRVVEAAKKIVGNIGYRISERNLPSIDDIINAGKGFLDTVFNNIKGFVHDQLEKIGLADPEQRQQLLEQLKEYIKSFPAPPSSILEIPEYLKELRQHIAEGVKRVVEAAKKIVGNLGNRISERDLPSIDDIINAGKGFLDNAFNKIKDFVHAQLEKVGLADPEQRQQLLEQLKEYIKSFPAPPSSILEIPDYLRELRKHIEEGVRRVVEAAKKIVGNLGNRVSERDLPSIDDIINTGKNFFENAFNHIKNFVHHQLEKLGLADAEQRQQLLNELKEYIKNFPAPPSSILEIPDYLREFHAHVKEGIRSVLEKAKKLVGLAEKRDLKFLPDFLSFLPGYDIVNNLMKTFQEFLEKQLDKLGVNDPAKRQQFIDELRQYIKDYPVPPLKFSEMINPFKWAKYLQEYIKYIHKGLERIVETAKTIAGNVVDEIVKPSERVLFPFDGVVGNVFERLKGFVSKELDKLGLTDPEKKQELLDKLKQYINDFPRPPFNPLKWPKYLQDLEDYVDIAVQKVIEMAKEFVGDVIEETLKPGNGISTGEVEPASYW